MTATTIRVQMAQRKDTAANWTAANPILLSGEIGYETDSKKFKIGNGSTNWNSLAYLPIPDGSGNLTITGNLEIGSTGSLTFEGSTANGFETTLAVTDPTVDRTITLPNVSGTVVTTGDTGSVTSAMIADGTIVNADVSATAEIAVSKLANGTANQVLVTDGTDVSWSDDLTLAGNLTVNGTTTTVNTQTLVVEDKNIELGVVDTPTDTTADGGGITLKGSTDKTINWVDATDAWTLSEHVDLASGKEVRIAGTKVLDATSLGSAVVSSSLTSVGTISSGTWQGTAIDAAYLDSTIVTTGDTGTVTSTMIADGTIVDGDVSASAAIAGTKISPDFGSQNVVTTGTSTAAALIPSGSSVPANGVYLPSANNVAISTNGTGRLFVDASGRVGMGTAAPVSILNVRNDSLGTGGVAESAITLTYSSTNYGQHFIDANGTYNIYANNNGVAGGNLQLRADAALIFNTASTERLRITSAGLVGVGTSSPSANFHVATTTSDPILFSNTNSGAYNAAIWQNNSNYKLAVGIGGSAVGGGLSDVAFIGSISNIPLNIQTNNVARISVTSAGNVGVGTTSPARPLDVNGSVRLSSGSVIEFGGTVTNFITGDNSSNYLAFGTNSSERARIDSSGRLLVGTSSTTAVASAIFQGNSSNATAQAVLRLCRGTNAPADGASLGAIGFGDDGHASDYASGASILAARDGGTWTQNVSQPSRLVFSTTADGASSPTERLRITSAGVLQVADAGNISVGTTTGTKIGTATTQKLGFYNKTPVVQPTAVADATDAASVITQLNALLARMRDLGLIAT